jgi:hypothetical protein
MTPEEKIELLEKAIKQATDLLIQSSKTDDPAVDWAAKTTASASCSKRQKKKNIDAGIGICVWSEGR